MGFENFSIEIVEEIFRYLPKFIEDAVFKPECDSEFGYGNAKPPPVLYLGNSSTLDDYYISGLLTHGSDRLIKSRYSDIHEILPLMPMLKNVPIKISKDMFKQVINNTCHDVFFDVDIIDVLKDMDLSDNTLNLYYLDITKVKWFNIDKFKSKIKSVCHLKLKPDQVYLMNDLNPKNIEICITGPQRLNRLEFSNFVNCSVSYNKFRGHLFNLYGLQNLGSLTIIRREKNEIDNYNLVKLENLKKLEIRMVTNYPVGKRSLNIYYPQNLEELTIYSIISCINIKDYNWPPRLRKLKIYCKFWDECSKIFATNNTLSNKGSLEDQIYRYQFPISLEYLELTNVVTKFTNLSEYSNLKSLKIKNFSYLVIHFEPLKLPDNLEIFHYKSWKIDKITFNSRLIDLDLDLGPKTRIENLEYLFIPPSVKFISLSPITSIVLPHNLIGLRLKTDDFRLYGRFYFMIPSNVEIVSVNFPQILFPLCSRVKYLTVSNVYSSVSFLKSLPRKLKLLEILDLGGNLDTWLDLSVTSLESFIISSPRRSKFKFKLPVTLKYLSRHVGLQNPDIYHLDTKEIQKVARQRSWTEL